MNVHWYCLRIILSNYQGKIYNMIQAYLNNEEIRMFPDIAIGVTIENFNISDIPNRKIDRTNVIRVPKAGNEDIFEFSSLPNAPTDYAYQDYDFGG